MMNDSQKMGGVAALIAAATFVVAIGLFLAVLAPDDYGTGDLDPVETVAFLKDNQAIMHIWYLIGYVVFGIAMAVLVLALHERLKRIAPPIVVQTATTFGLIWAGLVLASGMIANTGISEVVDLYGDDPTQAATVWLTLDTVINGIGGGDEIVGGVWVLLVSWAALRPGGLPRILNYLGLVIGIAGILTVIPGLDDLGGIFGLGLIVWYGWLGSIMLRGGSE